MQNTFPTLADVASQTGMSVTMVAVGLIIFIVWSLIWKGLALWRAGRAGDRAWFILLLLINSAGILDIMYLYVVKGKK